jgi:hypothetical protein
MVGIQNKGGEIMGVVLNVQTGAPSSWLPALSAADWKTSTGFISSSLFRRDEIGEGAFEHLGGKQPSSTGSVAGARVHGQADVLGIRPISILYFFQLGPAHPPRAGQPDPARLRRLSRLIKIQQYKPGVAV